MFLQLGKIPQKDKSRVAKAKKVIARQTLPHGNAKEIDETIFNDLEEQKLTPAEEREVIRFPFVFTLDRTRFDRTGQFAFRPNRVLLDEREIVTFSLFIIKEPIEFKEDLVLKEDENIIEISDIDSMKLASLISEVHKILPDFDGIKIFKQKLNEPIVEIKEELSKEVETESEQSLFQSKRFKKL